MSEDLARFVARRRSEWEELETKLANHRRGALDLEGLRALDLLYRRASGDLSRAQAFFPGSVPHAFLNQLCLEAYRTIYRGPDNHLAQLRNFFAHGFPRAVRAEKGYLQASVGLLTAGFVLGAAVVAVEPSGAALLVPEGVRTFVAENRMWTDDLLSVAPPSLVASSIATNNLGVIIAAFASGILAGVGTVFILVNNGVLLGAVSAHCVQQGMGLGLLDFVAAHGPVELSLICLCGAAGLILGDALVVPRERPRSEQLRERGLQAVRLVLGAAPFLALIAMVEGFISPGAYFPTWLKLSLGFGLTVGLWLYLLRAGSFAPAAVSARRRSRWAWMRS